MINIKLVDSLYQIIESLTPEETQLLHQRLQTKTIQQTPNVCGGHARIRDTRIPVWTIISFRQQGADNAELLRNYPSLTPEDIIAAQTYYGLNVQEIDHVIASHQEDDLND